MQITTKILLLSTIAWRCKLVCHDERKLKNCITIFSLEYKHINPSIDNSEHFIIQIKPKYWLNLLIGFNLIIQVKQYITNHWLHVNKFTKPCIGNTNSPITIEHWIIQVLVYNILFWKRPSLTFLKQDTVWHN